MGPLEYINNILATNKRVNVTEFADSGVLLAQTQSEIWDAITPDKIPSFADINKYVDDWMAKPHFIPSSFDTTSKTTEILHSVLPFYSTGETLSEMTISLFDNSPGYRNPEGVRGALIGDVFPPIPVRLPKFGRSGAKPKVKTVPEASVVEGSIRYLDDTPLPRTARSYTQRTPYRTSLHRDYLVPAPSVGSKALPGPGRIVVSTPGNLAVVSPPPGGPILLTGSGSGGAITPPDTTIRTEPSGDVPSGESSSQAGTSPAPDGFGGGAGRWNCEQVINQAMKQANPAEYIMHFHPECMQEFIAYLARGY